MLPTEGWATALGVREPTWEQVRHTYMLWKQGFINFAVRGIA